MNKAEIGVGIKGDTSDLKNKIGGLGAEARSSFAGLKGTIAGAFTIGAAVSFGRALMDTADQIQNTSEALGIGTDSLQTLKAMALDSGIQFDEVSAALNRITKAQAEALTGDDKLTKAFKALNISLEDLRSLTPDQILQRIGASLKAGGRSAEETAAAFDILGKSSGKMLGFLEELGSQGLDATIQKFKDLGLVMDEMAIKQLDQAGDALERFKIRSTTAAGDALMGWEILFDTLAGMSTGMSWQQANAAAAQGLGMLGGNKQKPKGLAGADNLAETADEKKWYEAAEAKLLKRMNLTQRIAFYEQEISSLQKSRAADPADLTIATQILEREKKIAEIKSEQFKIDDEDAKRRDEFYDRQDKVAQSAGAQIAKAQALNPALGEQPVSALSRVGGSMGGTARTDIVAAQRRDQVMQRIVEILKEAKDHLRSLDEAKDKDNGVD